MERLPEVPPAVKPVPVQESALVEFQESVEDCPWSIVDGEADSVAVGVNVLQEGGFRAPLLQDGAELQAPLQATQLLPFHTSGMVQALQVGGLFAPLVQGQTCVLQDCELAPLHDAPPYCGDGLVHVRVCVPPPHVTEQEPQSVQPPLIGAFVTTTEPEAVDDLPAALVQVNDHVAFPAGHPRGPELYEVFGEGTGWSVQLPEYEPVRVQVQLLTSAEEDIVTVNGFGDTTDEGVTFTVTVGAEQLLFGGADGVVPVHVPEHPMLPVLVFV